MSITNSSDGHIYLVKSMDNSARSGLEALNYILGSTTRRGFNTKRDNT